MRNPEPKFQAITIPKTGQRGKHVGKLGSSHRYSSIPPRSTQSLQNSSEWAPGARHTQSKALPAIVMHGTKETGRGLF